MSHLCFIVPAQCFLEYNRIYVMFILVLIYKIEELSKALYTHTEFPAEDRDSPEPFSALC